MTQLTAAQALLTLIDNNRRAGSTTALLESPRVASGEVLFVAWSQDALDQAIQDCPTLRGTTLPRLKAGQGDTRGPMVFDLSTVYAALMETAAGPRDPDLHPYEIVGCGESREVFEVRGDDGKVERIEPKTGSEKAWVKIRLRDSGGLWLSRACPKSANSANRGRHGTGSLFASRWTTSMGTRSTT